MMGLGQFPQGDPLLKEWSVGVLEYWLAKAIR